jgi:hypothetical protein
MLSKHKKKQSLHQEGPHPPRTLGRNKSRKERVEETRKYDFYKGMLRCAVLCTNKEVERERAYAPQILARSGVLDEKQA